MESTSLGQRVATALLPYLGRLTAGDGPIPQGRERALRLSRQLWHELEPHVAARLEVDEAIGRAAGAPTASNRRLMASALQSLFQDDPRLADRIRRRLVRAERREALRDRTLAALTLTLFVGSVAAAIVAVVVLDEASWDGGSVAGELVIMFVAVAGVVTSGWVVYRHFPRAINWLLVVLVVGGTLAIVGNSYDIQHAAQTAKTVGVFVLVLLPGWLYMQFVATRGRSLWEAYVINLFRLRADDYRNLPQPPPGTAEHDLWTAAGGPHADDPGMLYRRRFEAAYASTVTGGSDAGAGATTRGEGFGPVWITTLLTAFGWVAVLVPTYEGAMVFGGGELVLPVDIMMGEPDDFGTFRYPLWEALAFGFVGAYWFNLQSLVRRFFQNDLRTNAYISAIVRYVVVAVLVAVAFEVREHLGAGDSPAWLNGLAFSIGVFPNLGLQLIMKTVTKAVGRVADLHNPFPLTHLDGLNMWYEARLVEEGVEDLENLATADIVDLLLATRVPVGRTVDWIDQAHLYLRVTDPERREALRALGIRTATDLQGAFAGGDAATPAASWPSRAKLVANVLHPDGIRDPVSAVDTLLASFDGEINLRHVRAWRCYDPCALPLPGTDTGLPGLVVPTSPEAVDAHGLSPDVALDGNGQPAVNLPADGPAPAGHLTVAAPPHKETRS